MQDKLLSQGPPPLYESAADRSIELIDFMAAAVHGVDSVDVSPTVRETWRSYLARCYTTLPLDQRQWLVDSPAILGEFTSRWAQSSESDRQMIARWWAPSVRGLLELADPALSSAQPQPGQPYVSTGGYGNAPGEQQLSHEATKPKRQASPQASPNTGPSAYIGEMFSQQKAAVREAAARSPEEAARLQAQHDSMNSRLLTDMSRTSYRDMMGVIQNLRA